MFVHADVVAQIRAWEAEAKELGISPEAMSKWMSVRMYARQGQTSVLMQQRQDAETALRRTLDEAQQGLLDLLLSTYAAPAVSPETGTAPREYRSTRKELRDIRQRLLAFHLSPPAGGNLNSMPYKQSRGYPSGPSHSFQGESL